LILTKKEKERQVIELAEKGCTTRQIAKAVRISLGDIGNILKKYNGEECYDEKLSDSSKAFLMFKRGQKPLDVAIHLNLDTGTTMNLYRNYLQLSDLNQYNQLLVDLGPNLPIFIHLYQTLKSNGHLNMEFIKYFINQHNNIGELGIEARQLNNFIIKLYDKSQALERRISILKKYYLRLQMTGVRRKY
jgi:hypothetical protein